jgi:hypothetical protein
MRLNELHTYRAVAVFSLALVALSSSVAVAADPPPLPPDDTEHRARNVTFDERPYAAHAIIGFGSPIGMLGVDIEYNVLDRLALGVGAGTGGSRFETALLSRVRPFIFEEPKRAQAIAVGIAGCFATSATYPGFTPFDESRGAKVGADIKPAYWVHADVGYELRVRNGFSMFVSVGLAYLINQSDAICYRAAGCADDRTLAPGTVLPPIFTLSVGLGVAPRF